MSKYNLTDIFEQYQIGSGFTRDFDYAGMLKAGLETGVDTDIEILRKMSDDFEDVNYHRENNHLQMAIDALEEGAIKEASMFFGDFHAEIKSTMETFDMGIPDTLGGFMDSYIKEDAKDKDKEPRDGVKSAAAKLGMKPSHVKEDTKAVDLAIEASQEKAGINEVRIDRDVADKIEGMLSRPLKAQFLDAFDDLWEDLTEDDMFYPEDVINHLNNEMHKRLRLYRTPDPKPEEIPMFKGTRDALDDISIREESKGVDFIRALKVDANGTKLEIKSYLESLKRSGDKFDSVDDYVEDFKNYVADKSLQEHFGRFMKDYQ